MRDYLKMMPVWLCLGLALILLIGCSQERTTGQPAGSATGGRRAAAGAPTDQDAVPSPASVSGISAQIEGRSGEAPSGKETMVHMTDSMKFVPAEVTVTAGQSVVWMNTSSLAHTVTADPALTKNSGAVQLPPGAQPFNSGGIAPGQTFRHVFDVPGTYRYFCIPHEGMGMVGTVVVKEK